MALACTMRRSSNLGGMARVSAMTEMMTSVAFPNVAFKRPPTAHRRGTRPYVGAELCTPARRAAVRVPLPGALTPRVPCAPPTAGRTCLVRVASQFLGRKPQKRRERDERQQREHEEGRLRGAARPVGTRPSAVATVR